MKISANGAIVSYINGIVDQAATCALSHCLITALRCRIDQECWKAFGPMPACVSSSQFKAFLLTCQSRCTNFDGLIRRFMADRKSVAAEIFREAIERRIDDLLTEGARIPGVAVPVESGRKPRTVLVIDAPVKHANRLCG